MISDLLINSSVSDDLQTIAMFDGTANGSTVMGTYSRLDNISATVSNLNTSAHDLFQTLQQTLVKADGLQNDFDTARSNISGSLIRINETTQMLPVVDSLIYSATIQNNDNKERLSLLCAEIPVLQNDLQVQFDRVQCYSGELNYTCLTLNEADLNSTYFEGVELNDSLIQSEQEILNSSVIVNHLYNYSNVSLDLAANATVALRDLNVRNVLNYLLNNITSY